MKRFLLLLALLFAVAHRGFSATPPLQSTPRGVLINAVTRNRAPSKITFQLARNGKALAPIVISDKASTQTKLVAEELKKYLDAMSGASFQIQTGDGTSGIVLGNQSEFPVPARLWKLLMVSTAKKPTRFARAKNESCFWAQPIWRPAMQRIGFWRNWVAAGFFKAMPGKSFRVLPT